MLRAAHGAVCVLGLAVMGCAPAPRTGGDGPGPVVEVAGGDRASWRLVDAGAAVSPAGDAGARDAPAIRWLRSTSDARQLSREQGRPLVIYLRADWVAATAEVERRVWADPRVQRAMQPAVACRLDLSGADAGHDGLLAVLKVHRLPALLLLDDRGEELGRLEGPMAAGAVLELLQQVAQ